MVRTYQLYFIICLLLGLLLTAYKTHNNIYLPDEIFYITANDCNIRYYIFCNLISKGNDFFGFRYFWFFLILLLVTLQIKKYRLTFFGCLCLLSPFLVYFFSSFVREPLVSVFLIYILANNGFKKYFISIILFFLKFQYLVLFTPSVFLNSMFILIIFFIIYQFYDFIFIDGYDHIYSYNYYEFSSFFSYFELFFFLKLILLFFVSLYRFRNVKGFIFLYVLALLFSVIIFIRGPYPDIFRWFIPIYFIFIFMNFSKVFFNRLFPGENFDKNII